MEQPKRRNNIDGGTQNSSETQIKKIKLTPIHKTTSIKLLHAKTKTHTMHLESLHRMACTSSHVHNLPQQMSSTSSQIIPAVHNLPQQIAFTSSQVLPDVQNLPQQMACTSSQVLPAVHNLPPRNIRPYPVRLDFSSLEPVQQSMSVSVIENLTSQSQTGKSLQLHNIPPRNIRSYPVRSDISALDICNDLPPEMTDKTPQKRENKGKLFS